MKIAEDVEMDVRLEDCIVFVAVATFVADLSRRRESWLGPCRRSPRRWRESASGLAAWRWFGTCALGSG